MNLILPSRGKYLAAENHAGSSVFFLGSSGEVMERFLYFSIHVKNKGIVFHFRWMVFNIKSALQLQDKEARNNLIKVTGKTILV